MRSVFWYTRWFCWSKRDSSTVCYRQAGHVRYKQIANKLSVLWAFNLAVIAQYYKVSFTTCFPSILRSLWLNTNLAIDSKKSLCWIKLRWYRRCTVGNLSKDQKIGCKCCPICKKVRFWISKTEFIHMFSSTMKNRFWSTSHEQIRTHDVVSNSLLSLSRLIMILRSYILIFHLFWFFCPLQALIFWLTCVPKNSTL